jgi:hypothetical protein
MSDPKATPADLKKLVKTQTKLTKKKNNGGSASQSLKTKPALAQLQSSKKKKITGGVTKEERARQRQQKQQQQDAEEEDRVADDAVTEVLDEEDFGESDYNEDIEGEMQELKTPSTVQLSHGFNDSKRTGSLNLFITPPLTNGRFASKLFDDIESKDSPVLFLARGVSRVVTRYDIDRIPSKMDVPPYYLRLYSDSADIQRYLRNQIGSTVNTKMVNDLNVFFDYSKAETYYEAILSMFTVLLALSKKEGVKIPQIIMNALTDGDDRILTLRLLQDQLMVILVQLQSSGSLLDQNQIFIDNAAKFASHSAYMTAGLQLYFYSNASFTSKKAQIWKYRNIESIQESDFKVNASNNLYENSTNNNNGSNGNGIGIMNAALNKSNINSYYKWLKGLFRDVYWAYKELLLRRTNPKAFLKTDAAQLLLEDINRDNYPVAIYEDLIIALIMTMWLSERVVFKTKKYLAQSAQWATFTLPMNSVPMMNPFLTKIISDLAVWG